MLAWCTCNAVTGDCGPHDTRSPYIQLNVIIIKEHRTALNSDKVTHFTDNKITCIIGGHVQYVLLLHMYIHTYTYVSL